MPVIKLNVCVCKALKNLKSSYCQCMNYCSFHIQISLILFYELTRRIFLIKCNYLYYRHVFRDWLTLSNANWKGKFLLLVIDDKDFLHQSTV